jgi:hypothetical protein
MIKSVFYHSQTIYYRSQIRLKKETVLYPFKVNVTARNWKAYCNQLGVANLLDRVNYKSIIGIDLLGNFRLYIDWIQGFAWIED